MTIKNIKKLAATYGLLLTDEMKFNEMGIDFRVGFAIDNNGQQWLLRLPRRDDMSEQIEKEKRILELVKKHLSVEVPDWQISSSDLVAYPMLKNDPVLTFDAQTYEVSWHMDKDNPNYIPSLAKALAQLHAIPKDEVMKNNLKMMKPTELRPEIYNQLQVVKSEIGISNDLEIRYKKWLDDDKLWPGFTQFVHGDLFAGHVLTTQDGVVSGIIDWSTAHLGDPAIDFSGHLAVFGEESLKKLIVAYENQGGRTWDKLYEQAVERASASPLAYGFFAIETKDDNHIKGAKAQLGVA